MADPLTRTQRTQLLELERQAARGRAAVSAREKALRLQRKGLQAQRTRTEALKFETRRKTAMELRQPRVIGAAGRGLTRTQIVKRRESTRKFGEAKQKQLKQLDTQTSILESEQKKLKPSQTRLKALEDSIRTIREDIRAAGEKVSRAKEVSLGGIATKTEIRKISKQKSVFDKALEAGASLGEALRGIGFSEARIKDIERQEGVIQEQIAIQEREPFVPEGVIKEVKIETEPFVPLSQRIPSAKPGEPFRPLKKLTTKIFKGLAKVGITEEVIAKAGAVTPAGEFLISKLPLKFRKKAQQFVGLERGFILGAVGGVKEEPEKAAITLAAFAILPPVISSIGGLKIVKKVLDKIPASVKVKGAKAISRTLISLYASSVGLEALREGTPEKAARLIGRKTTTEIVPFVLGSRLGIKGELKIKLRKELNELKSKLPTNKRAAFEDYIRQSELLGKFNPKVKNLELDKVESIPPDARKVFRKFIKNNDIVIGGSAAQTSQVKVQRALGDIDGYVEAGVDPRVMARRLVAELKAAGIPRVSASPKNPTVVTIAGKKVMDFNSIDRLLANIGQVTPFYVPTRNYIVRTPEGIRVQRIAIQLKRKAVASFLDPKRRATGKFKKDLQDFKSIADQLFKKVEIEARQSFFFKEKRISAVEKKFGKIISRKPATEGFKRLKDLLKKPSKIGKIEKVGEGIVSKKLIKFKEPPIIKAAKLKASQKPFSKSQLPSQLKIAKPKLLIAPSQVPSKLEPLRLVPPSQAPTKKPTRIPPPFSPPSQPPTTTTKTSPPFVPPSQPPVKVPGAPPIIPFREREEDFGTEKARRLARLKKFGASRLRPLLKKEKKLREPGYNVFGKPLRIKKRGKKPAQQPSKKLNLVPLTKQKAKDNLFWHLDQSLGTTGRIVKVKRPAQKPKVLIPRGYARLTQRKFREFRIKKGKRVPTPNKFIEKKGRARLDTLRERQRIRLLSLSAQKQRQAKRALGRSKPPKLKSTRLLR